MPGVMQRIKEFARSPQGRRTVEQVRRAAADPRRRPRQVDDGVGALELLGQRSLLRRDVDRGPLRL
ncbi:hypothetical protein, partial [Streptomyces sp. NPDC003697]